MLRLYIYIVSEPNCEFYEPFHPYFVCVYIYIYIYIYICIDTLCAYLSNNKRERKTTIIEEKNKCRWFLSFAGWCRDNGTVRVCGGADTPLTPTEVNENTRRGCRAPVYEGEQSE